MCDLDLSFELDFSICKIDPSSRSKSENKSDVNLDISFDLADRSAVSIPVDINSAIVTPPSKGINLRDFPQKLSKHFGFFFSLFEKSCSNFNKNVSRCSYDKRTFTSHCRSPFGLSWFLPKYGSHGKSC